MRIAIYSRGIDNDRLEGMRMLMGEFARFDIEPVFFRRFYEQLTGKIDFDRSYDVFDCTDDLEGIDFMISLGGDGTLLDTVTYVVDRQIPIVGINYGRLGFLANIGKNMIQSAIASLAQNSFIIDKRSLVHLDASSPLFGDKPFGLNEFAIHRKDASPMIKIHTYLNGSFMNTYWADGLIIATPTGSTGYSLSCGGPILFPDSKSFAITPVSPHNLNVRPVVVPDTSVITFEIEGRVDGFQCIMDSRRGIASLDTKISVRKEDFSVSLVRLNEDNFLQTLRNKLNWGLDKRN